RPACAHSTHTWIPLVSACRRLSPRSRSSWIPHTSFSCGNWQYAFSLSKATRQLAPQYWPRVGSAQCCRQSSDRLHAAAHFIEQCLGRLGIPITRLQGKILEHPLLRISTCRL